MQKNKNDVSVVDIVFLVCPFSLFTIQPTVIVTDDAQLLACHWKEALPASSWCMNILKCLFIPLHRQMKIECLFNIFSSKYNRNHLWANIEANQTENKKRNHFQWTTQCDSCDFFFGSFSILGCRCHCFNSPNVIFFLNDENIWNNATFVLCIRRTWIYFPIFV